MFRTTKPYYITMGIAVLIMVISIIVSSMSGGELNKEIAVKQAERDQLTNQIAVQSAAISSGNASVVKSSTGIDMDRVATDNAAVKPLLSKMTTWSTYQEYCTIRADLMSQYGLTATSNIMKSFFPEYPDIQDMEGNSYNFVDYYKLSCSYKGMTSMVRGIQGDTYSYFTIVTCVGNKDGSGSDFNIAVMYSVDGKGVISGLDAYTLDGHVWVQQQTF